MVNLLYAVAAFTCSLINIILPVRVRNSLDKNNKVDKAFMTLIKWIAAFCFFDGIWGVTASEYFMNDTILFITSNIFHLAAATTPLMFLMFILFYTEKIKHDSVYIYCCAFITIIQYGMIMYNIKTNWMFGVAEDGTYTSTEFRKLLFYLQYVVYVVIAILTVVDIFRKKDSKIKKNRTAIILFDLAPILCGVFQAIYPDAPAYSIGYTISICVIYSFIVTETITERTRESAIAEEKLSQAEENERYYTIIDALASDYQNIYDVELADDSVVVYKNSNRIIGMFGDSFKKLSFSQSAKLYIDNAVSEIDKEAMRYALSAKGIKELINGVSSFTKIYRNESGEYTEMKCVSTENSKTRFIIGFGVKDAEIRKQLEKELNVQRSYEVIGALSETFDYVCYIDEDSNNITRYYANEEIRNILESLEQTPETNIMFDRLMKKLIPEDEFEEFKLKFNRDAVVSYIRRNGEFNLDFNAVINDVKHFYRLKMVHDRHNQSGIILGMLCVDAEKEYELELQTAKTNAEAASSAKSAFLFNMSHDIRTPMNAITGYTSIAKKYPDDHDKVIDCLNKIDIAGQQLLQLVNQVLDMSRIESGRVVLEENDCDIAEKMNAIMAIASVNAAMRDISIEFNLKNVTDKNIITDDSRLNQVVTNILGNAVKYTHEGGHIKFFVEQLPGGTKEATLYRFTVADNGIGMSKEYLDKIFDAFSRENNSTISGIQGTGLGMSIVKRIVDLMKGTIEIESEQGKGTTVVVTVPMRLQEVAVSAEDEEVVFDASAIAGKRILLVEDNEMNREIAKDILEDYDLIVDEAEDGSIAVEMMEKAVPGYYSLILMDIQMPIMNGFEATKAIRKLDGVGNIPIAAMTANAFEEDRRAAKEAGMDDHIPKPIDIRKLNEVLARYCK